MFLNTVHIVSVLVGLKMCQCHSAWWNRIRFLAKITNHVYAKWERSNTCGTSYKYSAH
jgi:hypothetical protein